MVIYIVYTQTIIIMFKISFLLGTVVTTIFFMVISTKTIKKDVPNMVKSKMEILDLQGAITDTLYLSSDKAKTINFHY